MADVAETASAWFPVEQGQSEASRVRKIGRRAQSAIPSIVANASVEAGSNAPR